MKKIIFIFSLLITSVIYSQVSSNNGFNSVITNSNVLLDGSTNFSTESGAGANIGKGIVIPSVNLVNFQFDLALADGFTFPTYFDGMMVYNNATGNTLTTGIRPSTSTTVSPGFYYFSNPNGATNGNITSGVWVPIGGKISITTTETVTNTIIDGKQVYSCSGSFTASGTSTAVSVQVPAGMTGYSSFRSYINGKLFRNDIYSFNILNSSNNVITGNGSFSEVYPSGNYTYVLEYFK
jgi:hypothetical protein